MLWSNGLLVDLEAGVSVCSDAFVAAGAGELLVAVFVLGCQSLLVGNIVDLLHCVWINRMDRLVN